jgi:hypothetical protein
LFRLRTTLEKHFGSVYSVRVLPDNIPVSITSSNNSGKSNPNEQVSFISAGRDSMINFWNGNGDCISSQTAHRGYVSYLSDFSSSLFNHNAPQLRRGGRPLSANNPLLFLSIGSDSVIKMWDVKRCRSVAEIQPSSTPTPTPGTASSSSNITKTTWCSEGNTFLSASSNGHIRYYEKTDTVSYPTTSHGLQQQQQLNNSGMGGVNSDWNNQDLASLAGSCTDLVSSVGIVACGSKAGKIMRWEW